MGPKPGPAACELPIVHKSTQYIPPREGASFDLTLETSYWSLGLIVHYSTHLKKEKREFYILTPVFVCYVKPEEIKMHQVWAKHSEKGRLLLTGLKWQHNRKGICAHVINSFYSLVKPDRQVYLQK